VEYNTRCIRVAGYVSLYAEVESEKELIFTGLLYSGKTPAGYAINFKTERISIVVVEVVIVVVAHAI